LSENGAYQIVSTVCPPPEANGINLKKLAGRSFDPYLDSLRHPTRGCLRVDKIIWKGQYIDTPAMRCYCPRYGSDRKIVPAREPCFNHASRFYQSQMLIKRSSASDRGCDQRADGYQRYRDDRKSDQYFDKHEASSVTLKAS
jgi:hypothetical protein